MKKENNIASIAVLISILLVGVVTFTTSKMVKGENDRSINSVGVLGLNKTNDTIISDVNESANSDSKKEDNQSEEDDEDVSQNEKDDEEVKSKEKIEKELKPEVSFEVKTEKSEEVSDSQVTEEATISGTVKNAKEVEYKLVKEGSVEPKIYLGKGTVVGEEEKEVENSDEDEWSLNYDFSNVPQGEYELYADVKNDYGTYSSEKTLIKVEDGKGLVNNSSQNAAVVDVSNGDNLLQKSASNKLKEIQTLKNEIKNDDSLTEEQKQEKLEALNQEKEALKEGFAFRKEAEALLDKQDERNLTNEEKQKIQEIKEILKIDSDGDGLPDYEEERLGSDPFSADSDQDGYLDGDEVKNGYDPLKASLENGVDKIVFQEPKMNGEENSFYQVNEVKFKKDENNQKKVLGILISGKALPDSFITLYIYSDPIVVTVKTDEDGNWSYILDKELEDGNHEVYAAVTDNTGKITSKSKAFAFVKTAQAITPQAQAETNLIQKQSPMEKQRNDIIIFVVVISILSLITALTSSLLLFKNYSRRIK